MSRDYYCRNKFRTLKVDAEKKLTYNCHAAKPHTVDFRWLKQHPGQLFNTDVNVSEREMMLQNIRNPSCEQNCWPAEDRGATSTRLVEGGVKKTHLNSLAALEVLDFTIGSNCNLTCSYCSKEFSTAWANDCIDNGMYEHLGENQDRYKHSNIDLILRKISQTEKFNTPHYQLLLNELELCADKLVSLRITGGEPLLHNYLLDILQAVQQVPQIKLFTGMGVNIKRFEAMLDKIKDYKNVVVAVSIENIEQLHEFNRYGTKWSDILTKIELLKQSKVNMQFQSTLSNLTIHGFAAFYNQFNSYYIETDVAHTPTFMPLYVIDDNSKQAIADQLNNTTCRKRNEIIQSLNTVPSQTQQTQLQSFLKQFVARRPDLSVDVFPKSFQQWINKNVV